jgi:hypothetical protein
MRSSAGLHDEAEFVLVARRRRLLRGHLEHDEIEVALAHVEIAFARAQLGAQRSSRRRHSSAGCTSWRTVCSGRASDCEPDKRATRLTTPSSSICSPRMAKE